MGSNATVKYRKPGPYLKRVPTTIDYFDDLQRFDLDNLYPQKAEELIGRAYTLNSVVNRVADFVYGEGWTDPILANMRLNDEGYIGQTGNDVLKDIAYQESFLRTPALHIGYNLQYRISSITPIDVTYPRLGKPGTDGVVTCIKYSTNWERDNKKEVRDRTVVTYNIFNPDPEQVAFEIEQAGGIDKYKGQILYYTPKPFKYSKASFDPVFDHSQAQAEIGSFKVAQTQNSFLATLAILYPGEFESTEERQAFDRLVNNKSGAVNAGSHIGLQDKSGQRKASDIFQSITPPNIDKLYELTEKTAKDAIMENEAIPKILIGVLPDSGMFKTQDMEDAYIYFNTVTRPRRARISRMWSMLMRYWHEPLDTKADISPARYIIEGATTTSAVANDALANMSGKANINLLRIKRQVANGKFTREEGLQMLQSMFGITPNEAEIFLKAPEEQVLNYFIGV
jgi:hypothetical protein